MLKKVSRTKQKEQRINLLLSNYSAPFQVEDAAIDLRAMSENYENGIIPSESISAAVNAVLGEPLVPARSVDPRETITVPQFAWVDLEDVAIDPRFQRDISPNHVSKIEADFQSDMIIVPCAVRDPKTGKYLLWDGNHTREVCARQGWTHIPVWFTEIDIDKLTNEELAVKELILKAGRSFLAINKKNKRPVHRYDEHMIRVECFEPIAVNIQNIIDAAGCFVKRTSDEPGAITHIEHLYGSYELTQASTGIKGMYLARALRFHTATWPKEKVHGIMLIALARMFQQTELATGVLLPQDFDTEFGNILRGTYGPSAAVHEELKEQYINHFGSLAGHPEVVTAGLILTYMKSGSGEFKVAQPEATYPVK